MTDTAVLFETYRRNARINDFLIDALSDDDLALSDGQGGMTVAQMLSHMAVSRGGWLSEMDPAFAESSQTLSSSTFLWSRQSSDRQQIKSMLGAGDEAPLQAVMAHQQSGQPFADPHGVGTFGTRPELFLLYMMVHDSNHRGQITVLLRQHGWTPEQLDQLEDQWSVWRESALFQPRR